MSLDATLRALRLVDKTVARCVSGSPLGDSVPGSGENGGPSKAPAPANNALGEAQLRTQRNWATYAHAQRPTNEQGSK